jgi:hypothetical protein
VLRQCFIGFSVVLVITLLLVGVWYGTRAESVTIARVIAHDGPTIARDQITAKVEQVLAGSYFHLVPYRFRFTYPETRIQNALHKAYPRLATTSLAIDGTELSVRFTEYRPHALWCEVQSNRSCLFVDKTGYAFTSAPQLSGGSFMRYVTPDQTPHVGERITSVTRIRDAEWFLGKLGTVLGVYPNRTYVYDDGRLTFALPHGGRVFVSDRQDLVDTFRYLETLLRSDEYAALRTQPFRYIDLRFGNKLYVNRQKPVSNPAATGTPVTNDEPVFLSPGSVATRTPEGTASTTSPSVSE